MSKVDALRAMREAKYARAGAPPLPPGVAAPRAPRPVTRAPAGPTFEASVPSAGGESETGALCGHRNMGGKICSRPAGHSEKNHRYAAA